MSPREGLDLSLSLRIIHFLAWPAALEIRGKNEAERSFFKALVDQCRKFLHYCAHSRSLLRTRLDGFSPNEKEISHGRARSTQFGGNKTEQQSGVTRPLEIRTDSSGQR